MIPRIREVKPLQDYCLCISFDDGKTVLYDVKEDIEQIESYRDLRSIHGLFEQVRLDESRTCVSGTRISTCQAILCMNTVHYYVSAIFKMPQKRDYFNVFEASVSL